MKSLRALHILAIGGSFFAEGMGEATSGEDVRSPLAWPHCQRKI